MTCLKLSQAVSRCYADYAKVFKAIMTRAVTMHRDTWAGDTRIVSLSVYRDTWAGETRIVSLSVYRDTYRKRYVNASITILQVQVQILCI